MKSLLLLATLATPCLAQSECGVTLTPTDIAAAVAGEQRMQDGDIIAARLALSLAAEHGSPEALRNLAETYDPLWLVSHVADRADIARFADLALSVELYQKAIAKGDLVASRRFRDQ